MKIILDSSVFQGQQMTPQKPATVEQENVWDAFQRTIKEYEAEHGPIQWPEQTHVFTQSQLAARDEAMRREGFEAARTLAAIERVPEGTISIRGNQYNRFEDYERERGEK